MKSDGRPCRLVMNFVERAVRIVADIGRVFVVARARPKVGLENLIAALARAAVKKGAALNNSACGMWVHAEREGLPIDEALVPLGLGARGDGIAG